MSAVLAVASPAWSEVALSDVAELLRGVSYPKSDSRDDPSPGYVPVLRATNIQEGRLVLEADLVYVAAHNVSEGQLLREGDIVVATSSGSKHLVGKSALLCQSWSGSFGAFCAALRPKDSVNSRYLAAFLQSPAYWRQVSKKALGVNINNLRRRDLETLLLPLPPLDAQEAIVAELEKQFSRLDEAVANLKRVKANLKRYKASVLKAAVEGRLIPTEAELARREGRSYETGAQLLQRILETRRSQWKGRGKYEEPVGPNTAALPELPKGWLWATADQICSQITDGEHIQPRYQSAGFPMLSAKNVRDGYVSFDKVDYVAEDDFRACLKRCAPTEGDVLIVSVGATTGRAAIVGNCKPFVLVRSVLLLKSIISSRFLLSSIQAPWCQTYIQRASGSTAQAHLYIKDTRTLPVPLPPLKEQYRLVAELERRLSLVREVETEVDTNLKRAERLRQSTLTDAFSPDERSLARD